MFEASRFRSARRSDAAVPRIGVMSGATSIAPIMTATLLATSPKAASSVERMVTTKNRARWARYSSDRQNNSSVIIRRSSSDMTRLDGRMLSSKLPNGVIGPLSAGVSCPDDSCVMCVCRETQSSSAHLC